ncbi:hypothetical protein [Amycolatopsis mediterranei]|uniref:hypothetical protein n=1 Tax=Amycolatopsis mediterranei TaxID=33910 RepID=UPI003F4DCC8D
MRQGCHACHDHQVEEQLGPARVPFDPGVLGFVDAAADHRNPSKDRRPRSTKSINQVKLSSTSASIRNPLDRVDEIVAPGTDVGPVDVAYVPPALTQPALRRRIA